MLSVVSGTQASYTNADSDQNAFDQGWKVGPELTTCTALLEG